MGQKYKRLKSGWLHLWRRIFVVDSKGRSFWRKFVFRFRTILLLLFIYLAFFAKRHLLDLVPHLSSGMVRVGDFYSNYTDELHFRRVYIHKNKKGRYRMRLTLPSVRAQFGRQPKGDKLIAVQEMVVDGGSVFIETWKDKHSRPQKNAFALLLERLAMVRNVLLMPDIRYHIKNLDVHIIYHGEKDVDVHFSQVQMRGNLEATRDSFCSQLTKGRASFHGHDYGFSVDSCFYADYFDFSNIRIFPVDYPKEKIKGHLTIYPLVYGEAQGSLMLETDFFRLARRPYKVNLPPLRQANLVYSFYDNVQEVSARAHIAGSGQVRAYFREKSLSASPPKKNTKKHKIRWITTGLNKATVNRVFQKEGLNLPPWMDLGEIRASGIHYIYANGRYYGSANLNSSIRDPLLGQKFSLDGRFAYGKGYLQVKNLSLEAENISLVGFGRVSRSQGWSMSLALTTGGMKQIQDFRGKRKIFVNLNGYATVTGPLSFPHIQTALASQRFTAIQQQGQSASGVSKQKKPGKGYEPWTLKIGQSKEPGEQGFLDGAGANSEKQSFRSSQSSQISLARSKIRDNEIDESEINDVSFYYHRLRFVGRLIMSWSGYTFFQGEIVGYPSRSSQQRNQPFWLEWHSSWRAGEDLKDFNLRGSLGNLRFGDYSLSAKLAGSATSPLRLSLQDLELWRENQLIISDGDVQFERGRRWNYNFALRSGELFSMRGDGYLPLRQKQGSTWELAAMGRIGNLAYLNKWGFDFDNYRGGINYSLIWRRGRRDRLQLRVNSDRLYWLGEDDSERYLSFSWRLSHGEDFNHSLTVNENSGWFVNRIDIRDVQQQIIDMPDSSSRDDNILDPLAQWFSANPVHVAFRAQKFSLDVLNPFWRSLHYDISVKQGILDGKLRGQGLVRRMTYEADLVLRAKEMLWGYNKLTDIVLSFGMGEKDYRHAIFSFANFQGHRGRIKTEAIFYLRDLLDIRYSINFLVNGLRYYLNDKDYVALDMRSHLQFRKGQYNFKGKIVLYDGKIFFNEMDLLKRRKQKQKDFGILDKSKVRSLIPANWTVSLDVDLSENLWIKSGLAHLELTGGAKFRFADNEASFNGRINMKRGTLFIQNNNFEIQPESHVIIAGFNPNNYQVELEAVTEIPGGISQQQALFFDNNSSQTFTTLSNQQYYDIYLFLRGSLLQPKLSFRSTPPLPRNRILAGIAMGQIVSNDDAAIDLVQQSSAAAINIFTSQINTLVEQRTGVDTFKVELQEPQDNAQGETMSTDVSFTVGQYLTKRMFVKYNQQLIQEERPFLVTMEYNITDWLKFVVSGGTNEKRGQDLYSGLLFINFNY